MVLSCVGILLYLLDLEKIGASAECFRSLAGNDRHTERALLIEPLEEIVHLPAHLSRVAVRFAWSRNGDKKDMVFGKRDVAIAARWRLERRPGCHC